MDENQPVHRPGPLQGLIALLCVIAGVVFYLWLGGLLGIAPLYAGFAFSLYFGGLKQSAPGELAPSVVGSLGGVGVAAMLALLPGVLGTAGYAVALGTIALSVYFLIMGWLPVLVNYAFMLLLTIATISALPKDGKLFVGMAESILLGAALMGALIVLGGLVAKRKERPTAAANAS